MDLSKEIRPGRERGVASSAARIQGAVLLRAEHLGQAACRICAEVRRLGSASVRSALGRPFGSTRDWARRRQPGARKHLAFRRHMAAQDIAGMDRSCLRLKCRRSAAIRFSPICMRRLRGCPIRCGGFLSRLTAIYNFGRGYAADKLKAMQQKYSLVGASGVADAARDGPQGTVRERRIYH